jgi:hypothetical protein|uniref:Uncharacterized protein n=1 Tax=Picea glauca TaxID=3330 RepID=A0A101LZE6_PICGL|nr:hypothetical protein ABT39_MTgene5140 [Picea glauca]QHR86432.1 hypothetical protein Q903MT_gene431 [Picea sitchensis]
MKLLTLFMALMLVSLLAMNPQLTNLEQDMLLAGMLVKVIAGKLELAHQSKQQDQRVPELANMDMHLDLSLLVDPLLVVPGNQRAIKLEGMLRTLLLLSKLLDQCSPRFFRINVVYGHYLPF